MKRDPDTGLTERQALVIETLRTKHGNITEACAAAGISRQTFYHWRRSVDVSDDGTPVPSVFAIAADDVAESLIDRAESVLHELIADDRNPSAVMFYLRTKGRHRGYVERQERVHSGEPPVGKLVFAFGDEGASESAGDDDEAPGDADASSVP